jgi:excisionase family DNA binding protein
VKRPRRAEPRIIDPKSHPRSSVCLAVAADFLGIDERTLRARIEEGKLPVIRDGKIYRIALGDVIAYDKERRRLAS